jgi:hypothetical protein
MRTVSHNLVTWQDLAVLPMLKAHAVRDLRSGMMELAGWLADHPEQRGLLVLLGSRLSPKRLEEEIFRASKVLQPAVYARIQVLGLPNRFSLQDSLQDAGLNAEEAHGVDEALRRSFTKKSASRSPRSAYDLVFEHLVNTYLLNLGPMTTESIMAATGFSYPPVADAIEKLGPSIWRHSDKRVELDHFPRKEWSRFISVYERGEFCQKFTLSTELARSPGTFLKRFSKVATPKVAIGGVHAARHYYPNLDLVGAPRLDVCIV